MNFSNFWLFWALRQAESFDTDTCTVSLMNSTDFIFEVFAMSVELTHDIGIIRKQTAEKSQNFENLTLKNET